MIQITNSRTVMTTSLAERALMRRQFESRGFLKLPALVAPTLVASLVDELDRTVFYERTHAGIGVELCATPGRVTGALEFLMNDSPLLEAISEITGCGRIGCFEGRVYRLVPGTRHYDSWHSDIGQDRQVAMSINLGRELCEGGLLQIRRADSPLIVREVANPVAGDAVLFRIDPAFRHRVGPLGGTVPRTACAGWFRTRPDFRTLLKDRPLTAQ